MCPLVTAALIAVCSVCTKEDEQGSEPAVEAYSRPLTVPSKAELSPPKPVGISSLRVVQFHLGWQCKMVMQLSLQVWACKSPFYIQAGTEGEQR